MASHLDTVSLKSLFRECGEIERLPPHSEYTCGAQGSS